MERGAQRAHGAEGAESAQRAAWCGKSAKCGNLFVNLFVNEKKVFSNIQNGLMEKWTAVNE